MSRTLPISLFAVLMAVLPPTAFGQSCTAATCNAASTSESDVLAALPSPSNTNATVVVNIPNGTSVWSSGINYNTPSAVTNLTIQGATSVNCSGTPGTSSYSCSVSDGTVIEDNYASNNALLRVGYNSGNTAKIRITGLTFAGGPSTTPKYGNLWVTGNSHNLRIDHNHFNYSGYAAGQGTTAWVRVLGDVEGVMDHNVVDDNPNTTQYVNAFQAFNDIGDAVGDGDGPFASPTNWGTAQFIYMEDNVFNGGFGNDCADAGRFVMRYNTFNGTTVAVQTHATKSQAGPDRGCRAYEFYHNYITGLSANEQDAETGSKNTTALIWGNTMTPGTAYRFWAGGTDREAGDTTETSTPNGWGYCGTTTNNNGIGSAWDGNQSASTGYPCLDGIGRGQDVQALNGQDFPNRLNSVTGAIAWPQQYLEPVYLFDNNAQGATLINIRDSGSTQNVDIFGDHASFDGTTGTGTGLLANRPTVCTPGPGGTYYTSPTGSYGVAYWATDANGGNGELYVCTATNTWTPIYQPYIYPHPLDTTGASMPTPGAPTSLTGTLQ